MGTLVKQPLEIYFTYFSNHSAFYKVTSGYCEFYNRYATGATRYLYKMEGLGATNAQKIKKIDFSFIANPTENANTQHGTMLIGFSNNMTYPSQYINGGANNYTYDVQNTGVQTISFELDYSQINLSNNWFFEMVINEELDGGMFQITKITIYLKDDSTITYYLSETEKKQCVVKYYNGTEWIKCTPYYFTGTGWEKISST